MKKIGVLTGGGDCPGLNAVIRAVTKATLTRKGIEVVGILEGYAGLVEKLTVRLGDHEVSNILALGGTILGTSNRANPFKYPAARPNGSIGFEDRSKDLLKNIKGLGLDGLVIIGGDGTLSAALALSKLGVPLVGVPKTIDNDLAATDLTFGFDSALAVATDAVDRLHTTAESHHRIMVLEVMGRYAGWIALRSGIAGGGDVILIPEIPYDLGRVCDAIEARRSRGKRFSLIVVAEGALARGGQRIIKRTVAGSVDPVRLGGVGEVVANQIEDRLKLESRVTVLGHLQRGGGPTAFDRWLATRFGTAAIDALLTGKTGRMVALHGVKIETVPLAEAVSQLRLVNPEGDEVKTARAVGTSFGD